MRCFSVKRLAILTKLTILARESDRNGRKRGKCSFHSVAVSSLFSKRFDERFNCGERKRRNQEKERLATLVSFRVPDDKNVRTREKLLETGMEIQLVVARSATNERTNHRWLTRSKENHDKPILFHFLSLSLSPSRFFETNRCQNGGIIGLSVSAPS